MRALPMMCLLLGLGCGDPQMLEGTHLSEPQVEEPAGEEEIPDEPEIPVPPDDWSTGDFHDIGGSYNAHYIVVKDTINPGSTELGVEDWWLLEVLELGGPERVRFRVFDEHDYDRVLETGAVCDQWYIEFDGGARNGYRVCGAIAGGILWLEVEITFENFVGAANSGLWNIQGEFKYEVDGWRR